MKTAVARASLVAVLAFGLGTASTAGAAGKICGQSSDMIELLIEMQKPKYLSVWKDKRMFVNRDQENGTLWAFAVPNTTVHPAAICKMKPAAGDGPSETGQICTAGEKACKSFADQVAERFAKIEAGQR